MNWKVISPLIVALIIGLSVFIQSPPVNTSYNLSMFYCGFSGEFCGQSTSDDINGASSIVILAFANTQPNGAIVVDSGNFPTSNVQKWQSSGKKVVISVGGQNGNWNYVFASSTSIQNFITSVSNEISKHSLDGVDLDIESYNAAPATVADMINNLRVVLNKLGKKLIIVSPEDVAIYQGSPVPDPKQGGNPFNYFVNIVKLADSSIDFYQPQAYNNWYDGLAGGSLEYLKDVYLNWRNLQGLSPWAGPIPNFSGVSANKLLIGILASSQAGGSAYYAPPAVISSFKAFLSSNNYALHGFMVWDSHWDTLNNRQISNVIVSG